MPNPSLNKTKKLRKNINFWKLDTPTGHWKKTPQMAKGQETAGRDPAQLASTLIFFEDKFCHVSPLQKILPVVLRIGQNLLYESQSPMSSHPELSNIVATNPM